MTVKVTTPNGSSDSVVFGSANTPTAAEVVGIDSGSSNGQLAFKTTASGTSTERMRIDTSGNVGIGTSSPSGYGAPNFHINGTLPLIHLTDSSVGTASNNGTQLAVDGTDFQITNLQAGNLLFGTSTAERMRIDADGVVMVGRTTAYGNGSIGTPYFQCQATTGARAAMVSYQSGTTSTPAIGFANPNGHCGAISTSGTTTTYATSSDYRLKENVAPMTGALNKVVQLNPVTYTWKADGSDGQGFIAHELQEVVPDCVTGEKDAVDENGNPIYQGIDTSFLVATLTAAIQEQQAIITELKARIEVLEAK